MKILIVILAIVIALELSARVVIWMLDRMFGWCVPDPRRFLADQSTMIERIINQTGRRDEMHPELGWACSPGHSSTNEAGTQHISRQGLRANQEYALRPAAGRRRIAVFGDSFVYANEVGNDESWPARIEERWCADVLNYGVGGYGADQALMRYRHEGATLAPEIVIMGFTTMMAPRMVSRYRRFQDPRDGAWFKPRFVLESEKLNVLPAPLATREDAERLLADPSSVSAFGDGDDWYVPGVLESPVYRWSHAYRLAYYAGKRLARRFDRRRSIFRRQGLNVEAEAFQLLVRVFEEFAAEVRATGGLPLVLMLPSKADAESHARIGQASYGALRNRLEQDGVRVLDAAEPLVSSGLPNDQLFAKGGHYSQRGNEVVAEFIARALDLKRITQPSAVTSEATL